MKKKFLSTIAFCFLFTLSIFLLPACSFFDKGGTVELYKGTSTQGGNQNTPNSRYSAFLNNITSSKEYQGSYKLNYSLSRQTTESDYYEVTGGGNAGEEVTKTVINGINCLDANNKAYFSEIFAPEVKTGETITTPKKVYFTRALKNIKTSDDENAQDFYVEKTEKKCSDAEPLDKTTYKTQAGRTEKFYLGNYTLVHFLPEFDTVNAINNSKLVGSREYSPIYALTKYINQECPISENDANYNSMGDNFYFIRKIDVDYLSKSKNVKADISMPEDDKQTILQISVTASFEDENSDYRYNNYEVLVKYYTENGKINKITQQYTLNQSKSEHHRLFLDRRYDCKKVYSFNAEIEYLDNWDTEAAEYLSTFNPSFLINDIASDRANLEANTLSTTYNNINVVLNGETIVYSTINETDLTNATDIINYFNVLSNENTDKSNEAIYTNAFTFEPSSNTYTASHLDVEIYFDKNFSADKKVLPNALIKTFGHDITLYARYIIPNNKCLIIIREFKQELKSLKNYYKASNEQNLSYLNKPIICTKTSSQLTYNYSRQEIGYYNIGTGYNVTVYIDNVKNTTNSPLSYKPNRIVHLDFYLTEK